MAALLWVSAAAAAQCAPADPSPRRRRCAVAVAAAASPRPATDRQTRFLPASCQHGVDPWRLVTLGGQLAIRIFVTKIRQDHKPRPVRSDERGSVVTSRLHASTSMVSKGYQQCS